MKKLDFFLTAAVLSIAVLSGCSAGTNTGNSTMQNESSISQTEASGTQEGKVITDCAIVEYVQLANTLQALTESADWIAKVQVQSVSAAPSSTYTRITPEVLETYRGDYAGQTLCLTDCVLPYPDTPAYKNTDCREYGDDTAMYYYDHAGNYLPQEGDILLFFGTLRDDNYWEVNDYQGMFLLQDGKYSNLALGYGKELLADDLKTLSGAEVTEIPETFSRTENGYTYTFQNRNAQTVSVPEQVLIDAIQAF